MKTEVSKTFCFPVSPRTIIIEVSSDTETEEEKDEPQWDMKLEEVEVGEEKEKEQEKAEQETVKHKEEEGELTEEEGTEQDNKTKRVFHVDEPVPSEPSNIPLKHWKKVSWSNL